MAVVIRGHDTSAPMRASCFACRCYCLAHGMSFRAKWAEVLLMVRVLPSLKATKNVRSAISELHTPQRN
jgi:hypothetical protein